MLYCHGCSYLSLCWHFRFFVLQTLAIYLVLPIIYLLVESNLREQLVTGEYGNSAVFVCVTCRSKPLARSSKLF